ncbi:uncharacterized protein METZ01_LOCUS371492, partial [marine metagenome]
NKSAIHLFFRPKINKMRQNKLKHLKKALALFILLCTNKRNYYKQKQRGVVD